MPHSLTPLAPAAGISYLVFEERLGDPRVQPAVLPVRLPPLHPSRIAPVSDKLKLLSSGSIINEEARFLSRGGGRC
eukprot:1176224-Prorocentrum_minimum.AAC.1